MSKLSAEEEESIEAELAALQQEAMPSVPVNVSRGRIPAALEAITDADRHQQQDPVRLPSVPVHQPVEEDAEAERREKQAQREEDLRMAMTA